MPSPCWCPWCRPSYGSGGGCSWTSRSPASWGEGSRSSTGMTRARLMPRWSSAWIGSSSWRASGGLWPAGDHGAERGGMAELDGKVALITGAGAGIGRAAARVFAEAGAAVGLCDVDAATGAEAARGIERAGGRARFVLADVADPDAVRRFVDQVADAFGRVDVLVNNAGVSSPRASVQDLAEAEWQRVMAINLHGHFYCAKYAVPHLLRAG